MRNKTSKKQKKTKKKQKEEDDVMSANCDLIATFPIYSQFAAIWKLDSGCTVCKLTFPLIVTYYLKETENRTKNFSQSSHTIALGKCTVFPKNADFLQKKLTSAKLRGWY